MTENDETRTVITPSTPAKVSILIGLVSLIFAAVTYWSPMFAIGTTKDGSMSVGCGSPASPDKLQYGRGSCQNLVDKGKYQAYGLLAAGLVIGIGGTIAFGGNRSEQSPSNPLENPIRRNSSATETRSRRARRHPEADYEFED